MAANIMDTDKMGCLNLETWGSQRLRCLAEQLQYYKPPITLDGLEEEAKDSDVDIVFHLRFPESTAENTQLPCVRARERRAAVLICVFEGDHGELRVILTKRSNNLSSHPGEVALPGGKKDERDEDDSATALREAREEIGLDPALVRVVAYLEPFISKHLLRVTPVVGLLARREDFMPILNVDEVDAIFDVPLEMFLEEHNHRYEEREWMDWKYILHLFDFESEQGDFVIWGLTASILIRAASVIYQRLPPYIEHLPDFQTLQRACMTLL